MLRKSKTGRKSTKRINSKQKYQMMMMTRKSLRRKLKTWGKPSLIGSSSKRPIIFGRQINLMLSWTIPLSKTVFIMQEKTKQATKMIQIINHQFSRSKLNLWAIWIISKMKMPKSIRKNIEVLCPMRSTKDHRRRVLRNSLNYPNNF